MNNTDFNKMIAFILAAITMLGSLITAVNGFVNEKPSVVVDIEEKSPDNDIRIMSFNIRCASVGTATWVSRIGIVSETINKSYPDSVGVQEATPGWMDALENELTDYAYVGVGRDDGDDEGEYSAIFYLKDKYNVIDSGTFWLSETPDVPSKGWDAACNRVCTWIILENKSTGESYMHINSHFDHIGTTARENSVRMILDLAAQHSDIPVVFTADMNINEGSALYNTLNESQILKDSKHLAEDTMDYLTYHDTKPSLHEGNVIDFIFTSSRFDPEVYRVVTAGIDGQYVSDHFPIYCDINFTD